MTLRLLPNSMLVLLISSFLFSACSKEDDSNDPIYPDTEFDISSNITSDQTWKSGEVYVLHTRVSVVSGVTLTIEPGTIIKGKGGTGPNATALVIARGARIIAEGTASSPIIFTSVADQIQPGSIVSPNLDIDFNGLWGGLIICGRAPISADADQVQIEGIPVSDPNGLYGGKDPADNSGVLRYVSIRHGGANIGEGNEINGLTLGGVGNGTIIENIEITSNQDDGIEFFGGTVDVTNAIVYAAGDDSYDIDQGWDGTLSNFIAIQKGGDHGLEVDGPEGSYIPTGGTVEYGSLKGDEGSELADFRDAAIGLYQKIYFFGFPDPAQDGRGDMSLSSGSDATFLKGALRFQDLETTLPSPSISLASVFKSGIDAYAIAVEASANSVGADKSVFESWTYVSQLKDEQGNLILSYFN